MARWLPAPVQWPTTEYLKGLDMPDANKTPTVYVSKELTYLSADGHAFGTPADALEHGLGGLLTRLSGVLRRPAGVVLLADDVARELGFTGTRAPSPGTRKRFAALDSAREAGWSVGDVHPWTIAHRKDEDGQARVIHVGILPWLPSTRFPLRSTDVPLMMKRLQLWADMLGEPYHGDQAGLVGLDLIRNNVSSRTKRENRPFWTPDWDRCEPAGMGGTELPDNWTSTRTPSARYLHCYDLTTQHLSAAQAVKLSPGALHFDGTPYDAVRDNPAGYYDITVPIMRNLNDYLPHPVGSYLPGVRAWVTHPTLNLLVEAAEDHGLMDVPEIHGRWVTSHENGGTRLLRDWASTIAQAVKVAHGVKGAPIDRDGVLLAAVKDTYKAGRGLLFRKGGRVHRPDWAHAIVGQARANLWRKIYAEGAGNARTGALGSDRWPFKVEADQVWYQSNDPDGESLEAWPTSFRFGDGCTGGTFTVKDTRDLNTAATA
jgi:hypothetical protein